MPAKPDEFPAPPPAQPTNLEMPEGRMNSQSKFCEERETDFIALDASRRQSLVRR